LFDFGNIISYTAKRTKSYKKINFYAVGLNTICEMNSQEEKAGVSIIWLHFFICMHWAGAEAGNVLAEDNANKVNEAAVIAISRTADLFIGIYSSFLGVERK